MAKSIIAVAVILILILTGAVGSFWYTSSTVEEFTSFLEEIKDGTDASALDAIVDRWEDKKQPLMLMINHRDVENISVALIRARRESAAGRYDMAAQEIEVAMFLMDELIEREKLSVENIF